MAIIGTGIAGMSAAYFLKNEYDLTIYEQDHRFGGHSNTITVKGTSFDTGFMVFNHETYPNLVQLFDHLKIQTTKTDMSFSVQNCRTGLEWCGSGLGGLFSQKKNLLNPSFYQFVLEIHRFNKLAPKLIAQADQGEVSELSLREFAERYSFSERFMTDYLIPMSGAVWSTPYEQMLEFPALTLMRFFKNHGLLGLDTQFQWYTVSGGSRQYVEKITAPIKAQSHLGLPAIGIQTLNDQRVRVHLADHTSKDFDAVVLATHGDQALRLLQNPTREQEQVLSAFRYEKNLATIHSDPSVMPKIKSNWSSWNFRYEKSEPLRSSTIYYMNSLQHLPESVPYFVSINDQGLINRDLVHTEISYEHPLFDLKAIEAQKKLPELNQKGPVYFVGSYHRYGFHEDALLSSVNLALFLRDRRQLSELLE